MRILYSIVKRCHPPRLSVALATFLLISTAFVSSSYSANAKKLLVDVANKSYTVSVTESAKTDYVTLSDVLEPLGKFESHVNRAIFLVTLNGVQGEFTGNKKLARIGKSQLLLPAKAIEDKGRLLVPVASLPRIVEGFTGQHARSDNAASRLLIREIEKPATVASQAPADTPLRPAESAQLAQNKVPAAPVRFFVMIDPAHGGDDAGARFTDRLSEKEITLSVARKLRLELQDRGINAVLLRDSDSTLSYDQRAVATNAQRAGLYVGIHAGVPGRGVRVYTAMLPSAASAPKAGKNGPFVPWETAQASHIGQSQSLANALVTEFGNAKIFSAHASAPLLPLKSIAAPAIAIEIAPPTVESKPESLSTVKYQQAVAAATAAAIANLRTTIEERR